MIKNRKYLKEYIFAQLSLSFFPIFLTLFLITSIISLVKIAALTSVIKINFIELMQLYSYTIPNILFFTLPISFFATSVMTIAKLSSEYELIVITSFGLKPTKILQILFPITFVVSLLTLVLSLGLIPKAEFLNNKMLNQKAKEANFNIKASEFGQKFGDWLIYIKKDDKRTYQDIKLFNASSDGTQFILAKSATVSNINGNLNLVLKDGKSLLYKSNINQIDFKTMHISDTIAASKMGTFTNSFAYWKNINKNKTLAKHFTFSILVSIFPLVSMFFILVFGYYNPRYENNKSTVFSIIFIVLYYTISNYFAKYLLLNTLYFMPIVWILFSYLAYYKFVKKLY